MDNEWKKLHLELCCCFYCFWPFDPQISLLVWLFFFLLRISRVKSTFCTFYGILCLSCVREQDLHPITNDFIHVVVVHNTTHLHLALACLFSVSLITLYQSIVFCSRDSLIFCHFLHDFLCLPMLGIQNMNLTFLNNWVFCLLMMERSLFTFDKINNYEIQVSFIHQCPNYVSLFYEMLMS